MRRQIRILLISLGIIFIFSIFTVNAEDLPVDIIKLSEDCGCELRYDYWKGIYELRKGSAIVRFSTDASWYLLNMNEMKTGLISEVTEDGRFVVDSKSAADVRAFFELQTVFSHGIRYIVLDPGHGGRDPGAIGRFTVDGTKKTLNEKDVVLKTAMETAALLRMRYPDKEILLTRNDDRYLKLEERTEIANSVKLEDDESMIFISIHANASFNTKATGFEVWYLPPEYRRDLIDPESLDGVDSDVIPILNTMLEEEYTIESVILGEKLLSSLDAQVGDLSVNRGPKEESWFVVRNARMPSVLIELGFVTNEEEAKLLSSSSYLMKLSKGIYNGVVDFINDYELIRGYSE